MTEASLDALAERAKAGDDAALEALVRGLQDRLYALAFRFLGHREQARDATQEILILVITKLSTFRGDSSVATWAYRVATRHLIRVKQVRKRLSFETLATEDLGKAPNPIEPATLEHAESRMLEEEIFLACTQAMLQGLDRAHRVAFILGGICDLESADAAYVLGISEVAFRKRLSRARATLDEFTRNHCGVADASNACRCVHQVNHNVRKGNLDPARLRHACTTRETTLEAMRARGEIAKVKRSLELYREQPEYTSSEDFAARIRSLIAPDPNSLVFDA